MEEKIAEFDLSQLTEEPKRRRRYPVRSFEMEELQNISGRYVPLSAVTIEASEFSTGSFAYTATIGKGVSLVVGDSSAAWQPIRHLNIGGSGITVVDDTAEESSVDVFERRDAKLLSIVARPETVEIFNQLQNGRPDDFHSSIFESQTRLSTFALLVSENLLEVQSGKPQFTELFDDICKQAEVLLASEKQD